MHRLWVDAAPYDDAVTLYRFLGEILCGYGACGDVLALAQCEGLHTGWRLGIRRGYSQPAPGVWRWSNRARHDRHGAPRKAPLANAAFRAPLRGIYTAGGELLGIAPNGAVVHRERNERSAYEARYRSTRLMQPGDQIIIGCQQVSPHPCVITYDALMARMEGIKEELGARWLATGA